MCGKDPKAARPPEKAPHNPPPGDRPPPPAPEPVKEPPKVVKVATNAPEEKKGKLKLLIFLDLLYIC